MKSYTDVEQSKKLAEILPAESADMYYSINDTIHASTLYGSNDIQWFNNHDNVPCWSLAALMNIYPMTVGIDMEMYCCWINRENLHSRHYDNPVDACVEMVLKLHELKML